MKTIPLTGETTSETTGKGVFRGRRGDPMKAQRCGAKTRSGTPCRRAAEKNPVTGLRKRCRLHGGLSTGPRTPAGKAKVAAAQLKHGRFSKAAKQARRELLAKLAALKSKTKGLIV